MKIAGVKLANFRTAKLLKLFCVIVLIVGVAFRFTGIEHKLYWEDEVRTSLRSTGYTVEEFVEQVYNGRPIPVDALDKYKFPNPEKNLVDAVRVLMTHPEHPPLYYVLHRFWVQLFGPSITVIRSLPILIGLLALPGIYWLAWELFRSAAVAWVAIALAAISPLHILYAQEAREYSLWTVAILFSSLALLRALRSGTKQSWIVYGATVTLGLYSHLLFGLVVLSHGAYVAVIYGLRKYQALTHYLLATGAALVTFIPWIWVSFIYFPQLNKAVTAVQKPVTFSYLIDTWFRSLNRVFFSADLGGWNFIIVLIVLYSIYFVCRHTAQPVRWFLVTLIGVTALAIMMPDIVLGGTRSARLRYLFPSYIGMQLTLAYWLGTQATRGQRWQGKFSQGLLILITLVAVIGCTFDAQRQVTWNKGDDQAKRLIKSARIINQAPRPLAINDTSSAANDPASVQTLNLSYLLAPHVKLLLVKYPNVPEIPSGFSHTYLYRTSEHLINAIAAKKEYQLTQLVDSDYYRFFEVQNTAVSDVGN